MARRVGSITAGLLSSRTLLLVVLLGAGGCIHSDVVVSAHQLQRRIPELRAEGSAEVDGHRVSVETEVRARGRGRLFARARDVTVGQLIDHCPDVAPLGPTREREASECLLLRTESVSLGEEVDWGESAALWGGAALGVAVLGVMLGVLIDADSKDSHCDLDCGP